MQTIQDALKKISLFSDLPEDMITVLAGEVHERQLSAGDNLFIEGDKGDALYVILEGELEITQTVGQDREIVLATFKPGDYFGEMALLDDKPRSANARAASDCRLLALDREDFSALLDKQPAIAIKLTRAISERLRKTSPFQTRTIPSEAKELTEQETQYIRVFISYSRLDKAFVQTLHDAIRERGMDAWVDWENIPLTADWWAEIQRGIESADAFAFVISPDSLQSRVCGDEIQAALEKNKRLIPILHRDPEKEDPVHSAIGATNWIFMRSEDDIKANLPEMLQIINTDLEWVQAHTRLQIRAGEWTRSGRDSSFLLRGIDLENAEKWLAKAESILEPKPTPLHREHINASIQDTKTQQIATRRQRIFIASISLALLVTLGLSIVAFSFYRQSEENRQNAEFSEQTAVAARNQADVNAQNAIVQQSTAQAASTAAIEQQQAALIAANAASTAAVEEANQREIAQTQQAEANVQRIAAETAQAEANTQKNLALSRQQAAQAFGFLDTDPVLAALLSLEAYKTSASLEARSAILTILQRRLSRRINPITPIIPDQLDGVYSVAVSPDGERLAFGTERGNIAIWNYKEGNLQGEIPAHSGNIVWSLAFSPDGEALASGGNDSYLRIWNVATLTEVNDYSAGSPVLSVSWNSDGTKIAAAAGPRVLGWTIADEYLLNLIFNQNLNYAINAVEWSPDGNKIAVASALRWIFILNGATGETIGTLKGHTEDVQTVAWNPDSNLLASGAEDGTVRLWDVGESKEIATLLRHTDQVLSVDFSQDGKILASGAEDRTVILWDMDTYQFINELKTNVNSVQSVAFSPKPGDNFLATASRDKTVGLYQVITEQPLSQVLISNAGAVKSLAFRPDGTIQAIATGTNNRLSIGQVGENIEGLSDTSSINISGNIQSVAITQDGTKIALGYADGRIEISDTQTGNTIPLTQEGAVSSLAFQTDGQILASSHCASQSTEPTDSLTPLCENSEIILWDVNVGQPTLTLSQQTGLVLSIAFDPDGKTLASGSDDGKILFWDLESGQIKGLPLSRHRSAVTSLAFSLNADILASGSEGKTIILWDVDTNQPLGEPLAGATGNVLSLVFNLDGNSLYSGDSEGTILIWDLNINEWFSRICSLAGRNLTLEEWNQFLPDRDYEETCNF